MKRKFVMNPSDVPVMTENDQRMASSMKKLYFDGYARRLLPEFVLRDFKNLKYFTSLEAIIIQHDVIHFNNIDDFARNLMHVPFLTSLNFYHCEISDSGVVSLLNNFKFIPRLKKLALQVVKLTNNGVHAFENLKFVPLLNELWLPGNFIGFFGMRVLAEHLRFVPSLRVFDLSNNEMSDDTLIALVGGLQFVPRLSELFLTGNRFGNAGISVLAENLRNMPALSRLALGGNRIGDDGAFALAGNVKYAPSLTYLAVDATYMTEEGRGALSNAVRPLSVEDIAYFLIADDKEAIERPNSQLKIFM